MSADLNEPPSPSQHARSLVRMALLFEGSLWLAAIALGWLLGVPLRDFLPAGGDWTRWLGEIGFGILGSLPSLAVLLLMLAFPNGPWRNLVRFVDREVIPLFRSLRWPALALIAVLAGCGEECLFRGVVQSVASRWCGLAVGVCVANALFALGHWLTPLYAIFALLMGLYFSGLFLMAGSGLIAPIVAHAIYDFAALILLLRKDRAAQR
ncbi:MAG TPA: CPBP family intramembrane glutamic endopeptidase, partial [Pirellulales bacterium]|nr:CPBP family intramembrane glutamic endopeptidase [Pirellulales bacterium]